MTSWECYENKWFYMKYIGKYLSGEILLTRECSDLHDIEEILGNKWKINKKYHTANFQNPIEKSQKEENWTLLTQIHDHSLSWLDTDKWVKHQLSYLDFASFYDFDIDFGTVLTV